MVMAGEGVLKKQTNAYGAIPVCALCDSRLSGLIPLPDLINHAACGVIARCRTAMHGAAPTPEGEGRTAEGSPGWGDSDAAYAEALPPPPGPLNAGRPPPSRTSL
jgi:hypothetical protein